MAVWRGGTHGSEVEEQESTKLGRPRGTREGNMGVTNVASDTEPGPAWTWEGPKQPWKQSCGKTKAWSHQQSCVKEAHPTHFIVLFLAKGPSWSSGKFPPFFHELHFLPTPHLLSLKEHISIAREYFNSTFPSLPHIIEPDCPLMPCISQKLPSPFSCIGIQPPHPSSTKLKAPKLLVRRSRLTQSLCLGLPFPDSGHQATSFSPPMLIPVDLSAKLLPWLNWYWTGNCLWTFNILAKSWNTWSSECFWK